MKEGRLPWTERYRPSTRSELVGNPESIDSFLDWIISWKKGIPKKRAALLVGPPGTGKTSSVGAIARDLDYEIVEFNASDKRNKDSIETFVSRSALQQTLTGNPRIILLDEVDGLSGTSDRGGVSAILKIIDQSVHPIVMTANDPDHPRLKDLVKSCLLVQFSALDKETIIQVLSKLARENSITISEETIQIIASKSAGDLRAAISDFESIVEGNISSEELGTRDVRTSIEQTLRRLFMTTEPSVAKMIINQADIDHDSLVLWLEENLHLHLGTPTELNRGLDSLSVADLYLGRIMRQQNWKLLAYVYDFLSSFIASSRTKSPFRRVEYSEPLWPLLIWKGRRKRDKSDELSSHLAKVAGISKERVFDEYVRTLERLVEEDPKQKERIVQWLEIKKTSFR
ncbi:MAG: replication factor C large subunit [Candidatus Thorarchaeota archaeon]